MRVVHRISAPNRSPLLSSVLEVLKRDRRTAHLVGEAYHDEVRVSPGSSRNRGCKRAYAIVDNEGKVSVHVNTVSSRCLASLVVNVNEPNSLERVAAFIGEHLSEDVAKWRSFHAWRRR